MVDEQDSLTGLANRKAFDQYLQQEWQRREQEDLSFSLILGDIDCFKNYNAVYDHARGDVYLQKVAKVIQESVKPSQGLVARLGGDEFLILLPKIEAQEAVKIAKNIDQSIKALKMHFKDSLGVFYMTLSYGIATINASFTGSPEDFVRIADKAMDEAKRSGHNCIIAYSPNQRAWYRC